MSAFLKRISVSLVATTMLVGAVSGSAAETLAGALAKAYNNNSELNSARAGVRVTDEDVAIAKSGYRPTVSGTASANYSSSEGTRSTVGSVGVNIRQSLFNGFQTKNGVKAAESSVYAAREGLRNTEQNILFGAVESYMDVIRDQKIAVLREKNVAFLKEQVRSASARFEVGEGTRTDVAQADAGRAAALAQLNAARAQAKSSEAVYRQIIGEDPKNLKMPSAAKILPKSLDQAFTVAAGEHPAIKARQHAVDASLSGVKVAEGALLPTLGVEAGVSRRSTTTVFPGGFDSSGTADTASVGVQLNVPIYQGGRVSAQVRQSKEKLGQARIEVDVAGDRVRAAVASAWTGLDSARASVEANKQLVAAAQLALDGVVEERKVGQRTTLDVLNAQSDVVDAQVNLATAEHGVVVSSYALLSSIGRLSISDLGLGVKEHKPEEHYEAVKDKWFGLRTPDGR